MIISNYEIIKSFIRLKSLMINLGVENIMRNTVIVLNEEFCSMSLAFQKAGYEVLLACESDTKSCNVYSRNINSNMVYESILDTDIYSLPEADVIAGKLEIHDWKSRLNKSVLKNQEFLHIFQKIVVHKMPKCVLYEVNANAINTRNFRIFIDELSRYYRVNFQIYKINKITNIFLYLSMKERYML